MKKSWYQITAKTKDEIEVVIYDEIGFFGIRARDFLEDFARLSPTATVNLRINSPGGDVFDGLAIHNILQRHPGRINVTIDGIAADIASVIAMAGDKIVMPENTFLLIHDPLGFMWGNSEAMRELAELLDKIKAGIVSIYAAKSGQEPEKVSELMAEETWLTAKEAKDLGFSDETIEPVRIAARVNLQRFKRPPEALKTMSWIQNLLNILPGQWLDPKQVRAEFYLEIKSAEMKKTKADSLLIMDLCNKAGIPDAAADFIRRKMSPDQVREHLADAPAIRDACAAAGANKAAFGLIKAGMKIAEVRTLLINKLMASDIEIDNKIGPEAILNDPRARGEKPTIDVTEIYGYRRKVTVSL